MPQSLVSNRGNDMNQVFIVIVQLLSHVQLFMTPWTAGCQASLSFTITRSLLKLISIESVMSFSYQILCCPLLLLPSIFPSIRLFPNESALGNKWPKYWSFRTRLPMAGNVSSIPGSGRSPGGRHRNPLQCSCLENPMDRGAWQARVHGVAKSQTRLSN